jgi:hypothetical protein
MGKKKSSTSTSSDVTVETKIVKLSYMQTLAINAQLDDTSALESEGSEGSLGGSSSGSNSWWMLGVPVVGALGALFTGKKKTSVNVKGESSGDKILEQWMHPYFDRIRYAVGIKDITASAYTFADTSEFVSTPFGSPKEIIKIYCVIDEYIPPKFDQSLDWIDYYIKAEGTDNWVRLNSFTAPTKFDETGEIVPKIINFNIPKPPNAPIEDKFQTTETPVKQVRFKAVIKRPINSADESSTPLLKSYRLVLTPKELL